MIKKFFLGFGEKLVDVFAVASLVVVFFAGIGVSTTVPSFGLGLLSFLGVVIVGVIYVTILFFFVYLMIDIREHLKKIEENTQDKNEVKINDPLK